MIFHYMAWEIRAFWLVLSWSGFRHRTVSMEMVISCVFFFSKASKFKTSMTRVPYNKLLTNLARSSRTGEYWPSVVFCTDLACHDLRGQYSPVRPSCTVGKELIFHHRITPMSWSVQYAFWSQNFLKLKLAAVRFAFSKIRRTRSFHVVV